MKKLIFIFLLLIIPVLFAYSQVEQKDLTARKQTKIILKEVTCPDCQGTGWIYTLNYLNSTGVKYARSASNGNASRGSELTTLAKVVCPYCGGRKTVFLEYIVYGK